MVEADIQHQVDCQDQHKGIDERGGRGAPDEAGGDRVAFIVGADLAQSDTGEAYVLFGRANSFLASIKPAELDGDLGFRVDVTSWTNLGFTPVHHYDLLVDVRLLLEVLSGYDTADPFSAPVAACELSPEGIAVRVMEQFGEVPVDADARTAVRSAAEILRGFNLNAKLESSLRLKLVKKSALSSTNATMVGKKNGRTPWLMWVSWETLRQTR